MRNIVFSRIDERLIHGQVMTSWLKMVDTNTILIVDDVSAKNSFLSRILKAAAPKDMDLKIMTTADAATYLKEDSDNEKLFILAKVPGPFLDLIHSGIPFEEIILGNMGGGQGRKRFSKNINASDAEIAQLKEIVESGTKVYAQMVPSDSKEDVRGLLGI